MRVAKVVDILWFFVKLAMLVVVILAATGVLPLDVSAGGHRLTMRAPIARFGQGPA